MLENFLSSIWASLHSWFTPTVLFVLLNLVIGTIAITSGLGTQKNQPKHPQLTRAPSVLERLKSINLYRYRSEEMNLFPSVTNSLQPPESVTYRTMEQTDQEEEILDQHKDEEPIHDHHHVTRSKSDTKPASGNKPVKLLQRLMSAGSISGFRRFEEEESVDRLRPSTVKEGKSGANELLHFGEDDEVDAKADDFINRFKQQLKLQRLESLKRYKEMLTGGAK